ncbi:MAG TPA: hypothetical protein VMF65_15650 [Acidimicrobiales bacterium]|nr:hypothetical protein [Acidimicrobiales bacterium]
MNSAPDHDDGAPFGPGPKNPALMDATAALIRRQQTEPRGLRFKRPASDGIMRREDVEGLTEISEPAPLTPPDDRWSGEEWAQIQRGFRPNSQDDYWLVLVEGDWLYVYRTLSGNGIYRARFEQTDGQWRIAEALIEANTARFHRRGDQEDSRNLALIIRNLLLSGPVAS